MRGVLGRDEVLIQGGVVGPRSLGEECLVRVGLIGVTVRESTKWDTRMGQVLTF